MITADIAYLLSFILVKAGYNTLTISIFQSKLKLQYRVFAVVFGSHLFSSIPLLSRGCFAESAQDSHTAVLSDCHTAVVALIAALALPRR